MFPTAIWLPARVLHIGPFQDWQRRDVIMSTSPLKEQLCLLRFPLLRSYMPQNFDNVAAMQQCAS